MYDNTYTHTGLILTSMHEKHTCSEVKKVTLSDHFLVYTSLEFPLGKTEHKYVRFRDYKTFDCDDFVGDLENSGMFSSILSMDNVDTT